jgi:hypothetical protein
MAVAFTSLKVGDTIYDCHRHRVGNTTATELGIWKVRILEINLKERKVLVSWNDNPSKWENERYFESTMIKRNPPEWVHRVGSGTVCSICWAKKSDGHRQDCTHPKAKKSVNRKEPDSCSDRSL